jgi:hypothetical protein
VEGSTSQRKISTKKCWSLLSEGVVGLMLYRAQNARLLWRFLAMARKKLRSRVTSAAAQYFQRGALLRKDGLMLE